MEGGCSRCTPLVLLYFETIVLFNFLNDQDPQAPLPMPLLLYDLCFKVPPQASQTSILLLLSVLTNALQLTERNAALEDASATVSAASPPANDFRDDRKRMMFAQGPETDRVAHYPYSKSATSSRFGGYDGLEWDQGAESAHLDKLYLP